MKVEVVPYNPSWPDWFRAERELLLQALGHVVIEAHHIGSTAVPGLAAKPIIDILLEVNDLAALDDKTSAMKAVGYESKGEFGIAGRRYFPKGGDHRTHQVHAFARGDSNVMRHLAFRDYLRAHPDVAQEYGQLKRRIAQEFGHNIGRYCDRKDPYVKRIEAIAVRTLPAQREDSSDASSVGDL